MHCPINSDPLAQAGAALSGREGLYWVIGGAGSGKTTVCRVLSARLGIPVYDMDAHIYGAYHGRFTHERHPVNWAWSAAPNALAWLLDMSWDEFDSFNRAALPEYLDLLAQDLGATEGCAGMLIDGGISNPALIAQVISARQMVCLAAPEGSSARAWKGDDERRSMKQAVDQLPHPEEAWRKFLEFDERITATILRECIESHIPVCPRDETASAEELAERVARVLGIRDT